MDDLSIIEEGRRMTPPYRHIKVECRGDVFCVRITQKRLEEPMLHEMTGEVRNLITDGGCRKMALSLGPDAPEFLYSIFLAKLISIQRILREHQGELVLCHVQPVVRDIFAACCLDQLFHFVPDFEEAVGYFAQTP
jgi:anti-anti-sigma factor